ncbi:MAG: hypothetical protein HC836_40640 [Richelia sp. RM2_1_2]|nr:hypothetical protein [Richelia sp. RM2_1_2]
MSVVAKEIETNKTHFANPVFAYLDARNRSETDFDSCPALQTDAHLANVDTANKIGEQFFGRSSDFINHRKNVRRGVEYPFTTVKFDKVAWPKGKTKSQLEQALTAAFPNTRIELKWSKTTCSWLICVYC